MQSLVCSASEKYVTINKKTVLNFASYNFLDIAGDKTILVSIRLCNALARTTLYPFESLWTPQRFYAVTQLKTASLSGIVRDYAAITASIHSWYLKSEAVTCLSQCASKNTPIHVAVVHNNLLCAMSSPRISNKAMVTITFLGSQENVHAGKLSVRLICVHEVSDNSARKMLLRQICCTGCLRESHR